MSLNDPTSNRPPGRERLSPSGRRAYAVSTLVPFIERASVFSGWTFDDLNVVDIEPPPPWDYAAIAREYAAKAERIIDLGTGGGEIFSRIIGETPSFKLPSPVLGEGLGVGVPHVPPSSVLEQGSRTRLIASEGWHVNAPIAHRRLGPLDVAVVNASSERTPWRDASFDLILSRHEAIVPSEVVRILRPGGVFLTQQVAKEEWQELAAFFPERTTFPDHFTDYRRDFEAAGLTVETQHHAWASAYATIGEVAFMLLVSPWEVPGFDPIRDIDRLLALEAAHGGEQGIVMTQARYLMVATKS